jgi:hypothetical protein
VAGVNDAATSAASSATNAATSATNAATSATNAATSAASNATSEVAGAVAGVNDAATSAASSATNAATSAASNATSEVATKTATRSVPANYNREIFGPHEYDLPTGDDGYHEYEKARKKFQAEKQERRVEQNQLKKNPIFPVMKTGNAAPPTQIIPNPTQIIKVGGSRKRRRIHKLSRRIERTLRRVQKKYGLQDDKNGFLRRTLRRGTYVPPQTPRKGQ